MKKLIFTLLVSFHIFLTVLKGMCVLEMVTGDYPYSECENAAQVYRRVTNGILPQGLKKIKNKFVREFIVLCLSDKTSRPSATELLKHPFMQVTQEDDEIIFSLEGGTEAKVEATKTLSETLKEPPKSQEITKPPTQEVKVSKNIEKKEESDFKVEIVDKKGKELQLKLFLRLNGTEKEIQFPFSLETDTSEIVAQEMASELAMEENLWIGVSDAIKIALKNNVMSKEAKKKDSKEETLVKETPKEEINFYEVLKTKIASNEEIEEIKLAYEALLMKHRLERENFYKFVGLIDSTPRGKKFEQIKVEKKIVENAKTLSPTESSPKKMVPTNNEVVKEENQEKKDYLGYVQSLDNSTNNILVTNETKPTMKTVKSVKASIDEDIHELMVKSSGFSTIKASPEEDSFDQVNLKESDF
jgi:hypothetical protein